MDETGQNRYVAQLKEEFDSCDTTGTGYLDKEELTVLCHKLNLDAHLPLLLDVLLGPQHYARVHFEEFKEGFVAVLSGSLDLSTSEEESSYLEPVPGEVSPKFVKGTKRYGRRSRPDKTASTTKANTENLPPFNTEQDVDTFMGVRRAKLRRSTSLESVESLKSDDDTGSNKVTIEEQSSSQNSVHFEAQGQLKLWKPSSSESQKYHSGPCQEVTDGQVKAIWEELGVGAEGSLNKQELSKVCNHIGLKDLQTEELDALFSKLDKDHDGRVSLIEFQKGLFRPGDLHAPTAASTPVRLNTQHPLSQAFEEHVVRSTSPSLLSATVSQRLLSRLDDGSGCTSPERVVAAWTEEGIRNSRDILRTLDFSMEERLSLAELSLALDNELLVSGNGIHQAALISYKDEIQFLQMLANQAGLERDKIKADLELADRRNLQLVREIDDRHATMESLNESKIKDLEQGYREKLCALRSETEQENEVLLQQLEIERDNLKDEVEILRAQEAGLQREVNTAIEEYSRLEEENCSLKNKLSESESTITKLKELNHVLQDKCDGLDVNSTGLLSNEERLSGIIKEYEQRCRELQDQNDELSSELEILKNQGSTKKTRRSRERFSTHTWSSRRILVTDSDSDDPEIKKSLSPQIKKQSDKNDLGSLESLTPSVSIETELAMEQLKERYEQNVQDLKIQLETKVNFYERTIELMKQNIEIERKEIAQSYKLEISELEEQKILVEEQAEQLRQAVKRLEGELRIKSEVVARGPEQERRAQREQAELEQNFAREIGNIVHRLTSEKDQLEAELKLKMNQEMLLVRKDTDQQISQMKAQFSKAQHNLLHQLHGERVRLQEQTEQHSREMGEWESRVQELDQEVHKEHLLCAEQLGEERTKNCNSTVLERNKVDEEYQREISQLKECICRIQIQAELQFKAEQKSVVLQRQLEEKLEEMCVQLEDNTVSMKAQDALIHNLTSELNAKEKEMDNKKENEQKLLGKVSELQRKVHFEKERNLSQQKVVKNKEAELLSKLSELEQRLVKYTKREQELLDKLSQFEQELESMRSESDMLQKEKKQDQENHDRLSTTVDRQQMRLNEQDMELDQLREQLEKTKDAQKNANEHLTKQLKSVEEDRNRLMQEITSQNVELEDLQAQCQKLSGDWKQLNRVVQKLQSDLNQEQAIVTQLKARLKLQQEEKNCLLQEKSSYSHLSDQLSAQIMEMEAESNKLTENLDSLKLKLQNRDSKLEDLRTELDAKAKEMDLLWNKVHQELETTQDVNHLSGEVQLLTSLLKDKDKELSSLRQELDTTNQSLIDSKAEVQHLKEVFDEEKGRMTQQLLEMEKLVIDLETVMDPASPHRAKMDEVSSENGALEDRLAVLHQDIVRLEEDVSKKRKKLEEMEKENVKLKQEQTMLHKENAKCRKEVLELSDRNLQLSDENSELNSRLQSDQGTVQMLTEKLAEECQEQEKMAVSVKQLQERSSLLEKEKLLIQITKQEEKNILEKELKEAQNKLQRFTEVESALTSLTLKNQSLQQEKEGLLKESEESKKKIEKLQDCIKSLEAQTIQLHSQIYSICKEKDAQIEVIGKNHSMLKESQDKVVALEARMHELGKEKEQLHLVHRVQEQAAASVFQEQLKSTQVQNQELLEKVKGFETKLQNQEFELQRLKHDNKALKNQHDVLEAIKYEAEQQILRANTALSLSRAQHLREVQQLKDQVGTDAQKQLAHLHTQLAEQQKKVQQQEEQLHFEVQQSRTQLKLQQEQYENMIESTHEQMDEVKSKLKMAHLMLQEKVNQLKEQFLKNAKSDLLMKDLYVENSQLMKALQITEQRQKSAEKKSFVLEEKVTALNKLLCKIAPISLTA